MRKLLAFPLLLFALLLVGCDNPAGSERRSLPGQWTSTSLPGTTIRMTITEVARSVEGAGSWLAPDRNAAFRVSGAHADETVSLLFEFEDRSFVNFLGRFQDEDVLEGTLTGGSLRDVPVTFERVDEDD